ncbi:cyclic nucleotide-binding domain-containing protein [Myxococcaceae bacterium GXIMD 01537]
MELRKLKDKATEAFAKGRFSKAAEFYDEYCQADPKDHQARLRMGDAWAKAGQRGKAIDAYHAAASGFAREGFLPRAIAASKLILELDPSHQGIQQMLADLYARRGTPQGTRAPRTATPAPPPTVALRVEQPASGASLVEEDSEAVLDLEEEVEPAPAISTSSPSPDVPSAAAASAPEPQASPNGRSSVPPPTAAVRPAEAPQPPTSAPSAGQPLAVAARPAETQAPASGLSEIAAARPPEPSPATVASSPPSAVAARPPEPQPPASSLPPGMIPRSAPKAPAAPPERVRWVAASPLLTSPGPGSAPPGLRPRSATEPEPQRPTAPTAEFTFEDSGSATEAAHPIPSISVSSFTELEMEADSLLHAVELAALQGIRQRAEAPGATSSEEETVFSITEDFTEPQAPTLDALPNIPLFSDLPRDAFIELFERCPLRRFGAGELIIEQGSQGDAFYVICEGQVRVFREEGGQRKQLAVLEGGTFFGEMALLSGAARTASVEGGSEDTQLLEISAAVLAELSGRYPQVAQALKKFCRERLLSNVMNASPLFRALGRKDRRELIERFRARDVRRGESIIRDGERTDGLYVVLSGEVEVTKQQQHLGRLREGDFFGEISLLQRTPATATVSASRHTTVLRLPREDFDRLIMSHPQILVLMSELTDERLRRTEQVLGAPTGNELDYEEDMILV